MQAQMLAPAAMLALWSMMMLLWMAGTRFPALAKVSDKRQLAKRGIRGDALDDILPDKVQWKAHNYNHLMEQPTVFYAVVMIHAFVGGGELEILLAWVYVGLRVIHSLWQSLVNIVLVRIGLFVLSSITLMILTIRAVIATVFADPSLAPQ